MSEAFRGAISRASHASALGGQPSLLFTHFPHIPLTHPGLPPVGPDFAKAALDYVGADDRERPVDENLYRQELDYQYYKALYDSTFALPMTFEGRRSTASFVLGGLWGYHGDGPRHSDVMVIGKMPGREEEQAGRYMAGPAADLMRHTLYQVGSGDVSQWYVSSVIRHGNLSPTGNTVSPGWIKNCLPILWMELMIVRPRLLLLLGAEATKAILGRKHTLKSTKDQVFNLAIPAINPEHQPTDCRVISCPHPASLLHAPERIVELESTARQFVSLTHGGEYSTTEQGLNHFMMTKTSHLRALVDALLIEYANKSLVIAVDAEWNGNHPGEPNAYVRTIQFSWEAKHAAILVLTQPGGEPCMEGGIPETISILRELFFRTNGPKVRVVGHYLIADMPWLADLGLNLRSLYQVAATPELTKTEGGWDTMIGAHAVEETAEFKLESLAVRLLRMPRHDVKLSKWRKEYCTAKGIKDEQLDGYGECPSEILIGEVCGEETIFGFPVRDSYGGCDADATRRLFDYQNGNLIIPGTIDLDRYNRSSRIPFHITMGAMLAYEEMHNEGIVLDVEEVGRFQRAYQTLSDLIYAQIRAEIRWPTWNVDSYDQCCELFFGEEYHKKKQTIDGNVQPKRFRPEGSESLRLMPYKTTGKRSKLWDDVLRRGQAHFYRPAADKEAMSILADHSTVVAKVRDLRTVRTLLKTILQAPKKKKKRRRVATDVPNPAAATTTNEEVFDTVDQDETEDVEEQVSAVPEVEAEPDPETESEDEMEQTGGVMFYVQSGNVLRSQFFPIKDTGRTSSARPALQNWGNSVEEKYKAVFDKYGGSVGVSYPGPIRSCLRARPGCVLVDPDYTGAEMAIAAWVSGDPNMIECMRRNMLDENDPDYFDMHSSVAKRAFNLDCLPTKADLRRIGKAHLRTPAKRVGFGKMYGQQAESMARKIREEGISVTVDEAIQIDQAIDEMFPLLPEYFEECRVRARRGDYIEDCMGRRRRAAYTEDRTAISELERKYMNFGMQAAVSDAVNIALSNFYLYRYLPEFVKLNRWYRILVVIHDAVVLEVPVEHLDWVIDEVIPVCMSDLVPIYPRRLDGTLMPGGPYRLSVPRPGVFERWTVPLNDADCDRLGIDRKYTAKAK